MKGIWLFHVSVMEAHLVLISALQSHSLVQLKLLSMWVQYINGRLKEKSLRAYLLYVMVFMPSFVWIKFTVCTGFPRYKCVTLLYTFTNISIHHLLLHLTMLIGLPLNAGEHQWTPLLPISIYHFFCSYIPIFRSSTDCSLLGQLWLA